MTTPHRTSGFTLLETILSLALTALIVGMMATLARQWLINWNRGTDRMEQIEAISLAENRLARDISSAISFVFPAANPAPGFIGRQNEIYLVRAPFPSDGSDRLLVINYRNDPERGILRRVANYNGTVALEGQVFGEPVPLLPAPYRADFAYQGPLGQSEPEWQKRSLPNRVRISISADTALRFSPLSVDIVAPLPALCGRAKSMRDCLAIAENAKLPPAAPIQSKGKVSIQNNTGSLQP